MRKSDSSCAGRRNDLRASLNILFHSAWLMLCFREMKVAAYAILYRQEIGVLKRQAASHVSSKVSIGNIGLNISSRVMACDEDKYHAHDAW